MKIKIAKTAGFCMGVRRAMEMVLAEANKDGEPLFTFGPLIHNNQVLDLLESKGVRPVNRLADTNKGRIVIRAHGIPPFERRIIKNTGLKIIDATCPKVARVQAIIRYYTKKGYSAVIVGDEDHPEVIGLMGYGERDVHVIQNKDAILTLPEMEKVFVVAQTTQDCLNYEQLTQTLKARFSHLQIFNTICDATLQRQAEVRSLANQVDAVVVVGGYHSGNTQRLCEIANDAGKPTFHIETERDLDKNRLFGMKTIGLTAGASTPNWMIKSVSNEIESIKGKRESTIFRWLKSALKFFVLSNLAVATGAFSFAYATALLSKLKPDFVYPSLAFLYIYAMHVFNRYLDKGASAYNDPERAAFLRKNKYLFITIGFIAIITALILSFGIGFPTLIAFGGFSFMGIVYSLPLVPHRIRHISPYLKIKDIPSSRTLSEALAWTAIIGLLPLLSIDEFQWPAVVIANIVVFLISYTRSALFDIFQVQGDLIVGAETLPIILGEEKTIMLLKTNIFVIFSILFISPIFGLLNPFSFIMLVPIASLSICLLAYEKSWLKPGIILESVVEANFLLAGILAIIWQAI